MYFNEIYLISQINYYINLVYSFLIKIYNIIYIKKLIKLKLINNI